MKKHLLMFILLAVVLLTVPAQAKIVPLEKNYVEEGDIVFASFHGVKPFIADQKVAGALDDSAMWLAEYAKEYNSTT